MTLGDKLSSSKVVLSRELSFKQLHIYTGNKRLLSLFSVIILTLYTVYTKWILNNITTFDLLTFITLINILGIKHLA